MKKTRRDGKFKYILLVLRETYEFQEFDYESVDALHPLASLEFFIKAVSSLGFYINLEGLEHELQQRRCRSVGPAMHCLSY